MQQWKCGARGKQRPRQSLSSSGDALGTAFCESSNVNNVVLCVCIGDGNSILKVAASAALEQQPALAERAASNATSAVALPLRAAALRLRSASSNRRRLCALRAAVATATTQPLCDQHCRRRRRAKASRANYEATHSTSSSSDCGNALCEHYRRRRERTLRAAFAATATRIASSTDKDCSALWEYSSSDGGNAFFCQRRRRRRFAASAATEATLCCQRGDEGDALLLAGHGRRRFAASAAATGLSSASGDFAALFCK
eukprot:2376399-Pleurochrysis_carterae.AAC.3